MSPSPVRTVLVTGATAGIGRATALRLARDGWRVFASGRRPDALGELAAEAHGLPLETLILDVTDGDSIAAARTAVLTRTGGHGVDAIVNNAGYGQLGPVVAVDVDRVRAQYETNVFGLLAVTRAFSTEMLARRSGRIVNVSSIGGRFTLPFMGIYNSTKYAVESLSDALRVELAPFGVHVALIEPGYIRTQFANTGHDTLAGAVAGTAWAASAEQYDRVLARFEATASEPSVVADAIARAVSARRPRARYIAPWWAGSSLFVGWLPTRVADWLIERALGVDTARSAATIAVAVA